MTVAQVQEMVQECDVRKAPTCWGNTTGYDGIHLIYAAGNPRPRSSPPPGHCHAPSCLSMELYSADTGKLLCRHDPVYGKTHEVNLTNFFQFQQNQVHDELGYVTIPPCLWGSQEVRRIVV